MVWGVLRCQESQTTGLHGALIVGAEYIPGGYIGKVKLPLHELHRGGEEGGVAEDIENVLAGRYEDGLALADLNAIDVGFSPKTDHDDK